MLNESNQGSNFEWITTIEETLISVGKPELFNKNIIYNPKAVKGNITKTLHDLFIQEWNAIIYLSSKGRNYHIFKENIEFESYLKLIPKLLHIPLMKFRTSNHKLPAEVAEVGHFKPQTAGWSGQMQKHTLFRKKMLFM